MTSAMMTRDHFLHKWFLQSGSKWPFAESHFPSMLWSENAEGEQAGIE